jgi:hypothetical protein
MLKVFISYSHKDKDLLAELNAQLATLRHLDLIEQWTDNEIQPGAEWEPDIWAHFNSADILILLISADFLNSYYCYRREFEAAEQRHNRQEVVLLPVIVRACDWKDGRLDCLQCLCADKPVSVYGDLPTHRDPAWALVVTEIRKVVTKKASAPPRARQDGEDSDGDLVPLLCNRQIPEQLLFERFFASTPGVPQIYFLPGREDAIHASFVSRVQYNIVPRLLGEDFQSLRHITQLILAEWVQKPPTGKELPYLTAKLAWQIDSKLKADAALMKRHPKIKENILIIQHRLYGKYWNDKTPGLLRDYISFWSKAADADVRPLIMIFFNVIFDSDISKEAPEFASLSAIAADLDGKPCSVTLFDPLGDVEWEHVDEWLATYFPRRAAEGDMLRQSLFANTPLRPMKDVECALRQFLG